MINNSDKYRQFIVGKIITEGKSPNNRINITYDKSTNKGFYKEVLTINEIDKVTNGFEEESIDTYLNDFLYNRIYNVLNESGYTVDTDLIDINTTDFYDGYEISIPILKEFDDLLEDLFNEIDDEMVDSGKVYNKKTDNTVSDVPLNKEPDTKQTPNVPDDAKAEKTQNPKRVDLLLKSVFESKFNNYTIKSDAGDWKPTKSLKDDGKLAITWETDMTNNVLIETILFPNDSNKIKLKVKNRKGVVLIEDFFEIYSIPTDSFLAEKFIRKTYINLLKKFIDNRVITLEPFNTEFIFWKTDNPSFSYSFSSPNKNKILLDLISFINVAKKPILDDFFEQNNLKHKQGYLQTLLDSAESAGIFSFKREGNEIIILKGPNYKDFLAGKIRRVIS